LRYYTVNTFEQLEKTAKRPLQLFSVFLALASLSRPLFAWNNFGDMVVASVAYRNLDSQTRAKVDKLLALNLYFKGTWSATIPGGTASDDRARMIFMLAATWPDAIKRDGQCHDDGANGGDSPTGPNAAQNTGYDGFNRHKYWHFIDTPFSQDGTELQSLPNILQGLRFGTWLGRF
jgi:hypothetical protein